jgi:hypothetical protein
MRPRAPRKPINPMPRIQWPSPCESGLERIWIVRLSGSENFRTITHGRAQEEVIADHRVVVTAMCVPPAPTLVASFRPECVDHRTLGGADRVVDQGPRVPMGSTVTPSGRR